MATIKWVDEKNTVILSRHEGDFTPELLIDVIKTAYDMIETVPHEVYVVQDLREMGHFKGARLGRFREMRQHVHPRIAQTIMAGIESGDFRMAMMDIYSRVFANKIIFFDTLEEAFEHIGVEMPADSLD